MGLLKTYKEHFPAINEALQKIQSPEKIGFYSLKEKHHIYAHKNSVFECLYEQIRLYLRTILFSAGTTLHF